MSAYSEDIGADTAWPAEATDRMNRMYRRQRHIYDGTRRYYLLGPTEMLNSAMSAISRRGLSDRIRLALGDGTAFDPERQFGILSFDHIFVSYSLSMIPDWRRVVQAAVSRLKPGGALHIVDFGGQERLPHTARTLLRRWLMMFDVTPRDDLESALSSIAGHSRSELKFERPFRGYAQYAVLTLAAERATP